MNDDEELEMMIVDGDVAGFTARIHAEPELVKWVSEFGDQFLHIACKHKQPMIASLLIGQGADVNAIGDHGLTPLHLAVCHGDHTSQFLVSMLLEAGADRTIRDRYGRTVDELARIEMGEGLKEVLWALRNY